MVAAGKKKVMIIAGETSGDLHGAQLVQAMAKKRQDIDFVGMGGDAMRDAGVQILVDAASLNIMGITEVLKRAGDILKGLRIVKKALKTYRPNLLILIDFPDFNLHVAKTAKSLGIRVLYYISPQIWAWRKGRVRIIKKRVDHVAVIFPFESEFYHANGVPATYVGHPLLDHPWPEPVLPPNSPFPVIGLLPGSRKQEIERHLTPLLNSLAFIDHAFSEARYLLAPAHKDQAHYIQKLVAAHPVASKKCELISGGARALFSKCHLAVAASGTVTLEAALAGVPLVVIYKLSPLSYLLGKIMIRVNFISLVNLIAQKEIVPELIQDSASPENISGKVIQMVKTNGHLARVREEMAVVRNMLGKSGAASRVARVAFDLIR